jgi:hypothetical protein
MRKMRHFVVGQSSAPAQGPAPTLPGVRVSG